MSERLLERADLQTLIVRSWEAFANEIGFPSLQLIGEEIRPHDSSGDRIDLLAFDEDVGRGVVIELKRDSHKLQLLQALSYAAMVATWDAERFRDAAGPDADEDLLNSIEHFDPSLSPAVMLVAEAFDPESS